MEIPAAKPATELRDRIAVALFNELNSDRQHWTGHIGADALADAVIAALDEGFVLVPKSSELARHAAAWQLTQWGQENQPDD